MKKFVIYNKIFFFLFLYLLKVDAFSNMKKEHITFRSLGEKAAKKFYNEFIPYYARLMVENESFDSYKKAYERSKVAIEKSFFDKENSKKQFLFNIYELDMKVGIIWYSSNCPHDEKIAWLNFITIDEEYRKRHLATESLIKVHEQLKILGIKKIGLNVYAKNIAAINLYKKSGYKITEVFKNNDGIILRYFMEKII